MASSFVWLPCHSKWLGDIRDIAVHLHQMGSIRLMLIDKCVNLIPDYNEINSGVATIMTIDWAVPGIVRPGSGIDYADLEVFGPGGLKGLRAHFLRLCSIGFNYRIDTVH